MGNLSVKEFRDSLPNTHATPQPVRSVASFDPRSPTCNIDRSPIVIEEVPSYELLTDPRSPSNGINRTPIFELHKSKSNPELDRIHSGSNSNSPTPKRRMKHERFSNKKKTKVIDNQTQRSPFRIVQESLTPRQALRSKLIRDISEAMQDQENIFNNKIDEY